jgi:hypothetical protein
MFPGDDGDEPANEVEPVIVILRRMNYSDLPSLRRFECWFVYKQSSIPSDTSACNVD